MKRSNTLRSLSIALLAISSCLASFAAPKTAFPGAIGFGSETQAGRGGKIIKVTNLLGAGPGSLRAAIETEGPRIVVFEVGGVIDLKKESLRITEPYLTIAGQTAPSPGITIIRGGISVTANDILIQHIAVRPGDAGEPKKSGWEPDGIAVSSGHHGKIGKNIVFDHVSATWSVDENLSVSGPRHEGETSSNVTMSNCLIAECLHDSSHAKGPHGKGSLIHDRVQNVSIINCFYAHNSARNPYFKIGTTGAVVNNLIYNPGEMAARTSWVPSEWEGRAPPPPQTVSFVGNVMIHGVDTPPERTFLYSTIGRIHMKDNQAMLSNGEKKELFSGDAEFTKKAIVWPEGLKAMPSSKVIDHVLKNVGSRPKDRDPIDQRIIDDFKARKGRIIHSQDEAGGYPDYRPVSRQLDVPDSNIDEWLESFSKAVEFQN